MTTGTNQRIPLQILAADRETLLALLSLSDYTPIKPDCTTAALQQLEAELTQAENAEIIARRALEIAREQAVRAGRVFHGAMLSAKAQVIAQYGEDSPALHAVGRKQKSERRRPKRRTVSMPAQ
ncbi:MAG: hypothetical protein HGA45_35320 [Chloroflexales bacterium]|nr:hypothetical protein [Chloroflexales bacterium]